MDVGEQIYLGVINELIKGLRKAFGRDLRMEQANYEDGEMTLFALRFPTGFKDGGRVKVWDEVLVCNYKLILDERKNEELIKALNGWEPFKYDYYNERFSRTIFVVPEPKKIRGFFYTKTIRKRVFLSPYACKINKYTTYVVLNTKLRKEKVLATFLAYLTNFYANRANSFVESLYDNKSRRVSIWRRVRAVFKGRLLSLRKSLSRFYNSIYYRIEFLEEKGKLSEDVAKIGKLLADLFFTFAKLFDVYGKVIFYSIVAKEIIDELKELVGFSKIPETVKHVIALWNHLNERWLRYQARKVLRAET